MLAVRHRKTLDLTQTTSDILLPMFLSIHILAIISIITNNIGRIIIINPSRVPGHHGGYPLHNKHNRRVDVRAKPPLAGCVNLEPKEKAGLFPTGLAIL